MIGHRRTPTFSQTLFEIEYNLCHEYGALSPDMIDRMSYIEAIEMYAETRRVQIELNRIAEQEKDMPKYIPATTNDW